MPKPKPRLIKGWREVVRGPGRPGLRYPFAPAAPAPAAVPGRERHPNAEDPPPAEKAG